MSLKAGIIALVCRTATPRNPLCIGCGKSPREIEEYIHNPEEDPNPIRFVRENEGTFNHRNGHFTCTECYIKMGMPTKPGGWIAP